MSHGLRYKATSWENRSRGLRVLACKIAPVWKTEKGISLKLTVNYSQEERGSQRTICPTTKEQMFSM